MLDVRTPQENETQALVGSYLLRSWNWISGKGTPERQIDRSLLQGKQPECLACSYLSQLGYKVKNLEGGIMLWNMAGNASLG